MQFWILQFYVMCPLVGLNVLHVFDGSCISEREANVTGLT